MIVPPVFPCRSVSLFVPVSRSPFSPGLHQSHPQLPVYIRSPSTSGFSFRLRFTYACQSSFASGSPSASRLHPVHHPLPDFSFRLRFTCVCQSRYSFCLLFSLSPFCPELSFPFLPSLSAPFCRPASPLPCSG